MMIVMELLTKLQKTYGVDRERLYVSGQSAGGFATWALTAECFDMFAAAVPACAGGNELKAAQVIGTPIWAFHGEMNTFVKVERSRQMIADIKKAGGTLLYIEYKGEGHVIWDRVFSEKEIRY
jgi:predicted peptidase